MKEILIITSFISGLLALGLGVFVFLGGLKKKLNLLFFLYCLAISIWLLATSQVLRSETDEAIIFWDRIVYLGVVFIPIFVYHFGTIFVGREKENRYIIYSGYFLAFVFFVLSRTDYFIDGVYKYSWGVHTQAKFFHHLFLIFFSGYIFLFFREIYNFFQKVKKEQKKIEQIQAKYIFLSFVGFAIGSYAFLSAYGIDINPLGAYLGGILAASLLFFSITKYHLFEVRVILIEILVGAMGILLLVFSFLLPENYRIFGIGIFLLFCVFAYCLIKATHEEARQREKAEIMAVREKAFREKAEKLNRLKTEFLAMASHQLRTPPTSIKGYISLILEGGYGKISAEARDVLKKIFGANERLIRIVNQFLTAANLDLGRLRPEIKEIFLEKEILESLTEEFRPKIEAKNLYLKFEKPEVLTRVFIDPDQLKEVFSNLLDNATKYTPKGGIEVSVKKQEKSVLVAIKDTGEGLTQKEKLIIFESFGKGKAGYLHWMEGAGLGLYITKKLIELNKGKIWAESEGKNKGSTFYIELPLKESLRLPTGQAIK